MHGYGFTMQYPCGWVSPFGHRGINAYCQLPHAFRRLSRPSSPLTAKASTVCAYSLDHITASCLGLHAHGGTKPTHEYNDSINKETCVSRLSLTTRLIDNLKRSLRHKLLKNRSRPQCRTLSILSYAPNHSEWWVWEDSNHRPHPYQGCALTT